MQTFCCVQCRLLQAPGTACAECGASMVAPVELVRELLHYRDMRFVRQRDWGLVAAFLAGSSLWMPILAPFAGASIVALGLAKWRELRRRQEIAGIALAPPVPAANATTLYGVARRFRGAGDVLVSHAAVSDAKGGLLLRRTNAQPFLLDAADGPVLVTGAVRVRTPSFVVGRAAARREDLQAMGVPDDLKVNGELETTELRVDADHVAVTGMLVDEAVPELAFNRDGGGVRVLRGVPGAPLIVSDRRLVGVAI